MAEEQVIGTARVDIVVDADGVEVATKKAKESISSMSREAQQEYAKLTAAQKRQVDGLLKNADQLGMTRSEQAAYNATLKTSGALHDEVIKRIRAHEAAQVSDNAALDMGYRSHKQLQQAMRGTPAQISDIVVSLQGGQRPMTVFLQQGLQLRDMFGSWKQVAVGAGSAVVGMVNPITLAASAAGALFAAWQMGQKEAQAFNKAIVMSGNVAGLSAGELQTMARQVGEVTGTQREASGVLAQMAGSANIAKEGMAGYAETAINLNRLVGKSVEETIGDFESLGKSPVEASQKLNEQYGYLTFAVYEQIKALEEQGRTDEAAELAQQTYKKAMDERATSIEANLGTLEKAWASVGGAASKAWDFMLNIGREASLEDRIQAQIKTIENLQTAYDNLTYKDKGPALKALAALDAAKETLATLQQTKTTQDENNEANAEAARLSREQTAAAVEWGKVVASNLSNEEKQREQIKKIREVGIALGKSEADIEAQITALRAKNQPKNGGGGRSAGDAELASIRARIAAQDELLERLKIHGTETQKLTEGERIVLKLQEDLTGKLSARQRATKELALEEAKRLVTAEKATQAEEDRIKREQAFTKEIDESRKARQKQVDEMLKTVEQMDKSNTTLREEIELIGKSRQEQARILIGREQQRLAVAELRLAELQRAADLGQSTTQELYAQQQIVDKIRERIALLENKDFAEGNAEAAKLIASQWDKTAKTIGDTLNDYIIGGGKSAAEYLERLFAALVLRPIVEAGVGSVMGLFGGGQGAAAQSGGFWNSLGNAGGGFTNWSGWGGNLSSGIGNLGNSIGGGLGESLVSLGSTVSEFDAWLQDIPGFEGGLGSAAGYAGAIFQMFQGNYGSGIGSAIGTAIMPGIGTMLGGLIGGWIDGLDGSGDPHRGAVGHYQTGNGGQNYAAGATDYDADIGMGLQVFAAAIGGSFESFLASFGQSARVDVAANWADDFDGEGESWGGFVLQMQDALGEWKTLVDWSADGVGRFGQARDFGPGEEGYAEFITAVSQSYVEALKQVDLPEWASGMLDGIASDASIETIATTLNQLAVMRETLGSWQTYLVEFGNVGDAAFGALLESMGGFENLSSGVAAFVDLFYSDAEKLEMSQKQIAEQLAKFDLKMPMLDLSDETMDTAEEVKAAWRSMVEEALAAGEEGAELAAMLLNLGPAFASATDAAEAAAQAEKERAQAQIDELYSSAGISGDTIAQILRDGMLGRLTQEDVGAQLSGQIIDGIYNSIAGGFAQQITDTFTSGIITPLLQAAATGSAMSGIVSQASMDAVLAQARASMAALQAILNDPALQQLMADLQITIKGLNIGSVAAPVVARPVYSGGGGGGGGRSTANNGESERLGLMRQIYELEGNYAALRKMELDALTAGNRPLQERIYALQAQQQVDEQIARMDAELLKLSGDTEAQRAKQLQDITKSLAQYMLSAEQLNSVLDKQNELWAAQDAAAAQSEFDGLWKQWLQRTDEAAAIELERAALLSDTSRALFDQIKAYDKLKSAITSATGTLQTEIDRLMNSITESAAGTAYYESQFAILTAQARAGDTDAAAKLPSIVQALEKSVTEGAASEYEIRAAQFGYMTSLEETQRILNEILSAAGVYQPGGAAVGGTVVSPQVEVINSVSNVMIPALTAGNNTNAELLAEVRRLNEKVDRLEAINRANVTQTKRVGDKLDQFGEEGLKVV